MSVNLGFRSAQRRAGNLRCKVRISLAAFVMFSLVYAVAFCAFFLFVLELLRHRR